MSHATPFIKFMGHISHVGKAAKVGQTIRRCEVCDHFGTRRVTWDEAKPVLTAQQG